MKKWNWEKSNWGTFKKNPKVYKSLELEYDNLSFIVPPSSNTTSNLSLINLLTDSVTEEILFTSLIEGVNLDKEKLFISIYKRLGINLKTINNTVTATREEQFVQLMFKIYEDFNSPLTQEILFDYHKLVCGNDTLEHIGEYRTDSIYIGSNNMADDTVYFEAPPADTIQSEMDKFINWFNNDSKSLSAIERSALTHSYFVSIHPFQDGNGRLSRALAQKALFQSQGYASLLNLSKTIHNSPKSYYENLQKLSSVENNDVTHWIEYWSETLIKSKITIKKSINRSINFQNLKANHYENLNERQKKLLNLIFKEDEFKGKIQLKKFSKIAKSKVTERTLQNDLKELVDKDILEKRGHLKGTHYLISQSFSKDLLDNKEQKSSSGILYDTPPSHVEERKEYYHSSSPKFRKDLEELFEKNNRVLTDDIFSEIFKNYAKAPSHKDKTAL